MAKYGNVEISDNMHGRLKPCGICYKMILVEETHNGVSHLMSQVASHWDCLTPEQQAAAKQHYKLEI